MPDRKRARTLHKCHVIGTRHAYTHSGALAVYVFAVLIGTRVTSSRGYILAITILNCASLKQLSVLTSVYPHRKKKIKNGFARKFVFCLNG